MGGGKGLLAACLLGLAAPGWAAPAITAATITGGRASGNPFSVTGTGFGATGPTMVLFDDFETGTSGSDIATGAGSAPVGQWNALGAVHPTYSNVNALSGSKAFRGDYASSFSNYAEVVFGTTITDFFISYSWYVPSDKNLPGETGAPPNDLNWKIMWLAATSTTDGDAALPVTNDTASPQWSIQGNDSPYVRYFTAPEAPLKGQWHQYQAYLRASDTAGVVQLWETRTTGVATLVNDLSSATVFTGDLWQGIHANAFGRQTANCNIYLDDIYMARASGAAARARVEIGNNATWASCTKRAIFTPTSWSDTLIAGTVRMGAFSAGETAYLFVIDSAGTASAGLSLSSAGVTTTQPTVPFRTVAP